MPQSLRDHLRRRITRLRATLGRRAAGIGAALLAEALLVLLLLTLAPDVTRPRGEKSTVFAFSPEQDVPAPTDEPRAQAEEPRSPRKPSRPPQRDERADTTQPEPATQPLPPPSVVRLSREQMAAADIATIPSAATAPAPPRRMPAGPPDTGGSSPDTPRVSGTGPNGEPLYAASWYREPYPEELRGYLSTARGPGWGLIACRTVLDYRVEDCVIVGEYPEGSNIGRSVLAAAWQFRVRPPRLGGELRFGEWVRIRIDYTLRD